MDIFFDKIVNKQKRDIRFENIEFTIHPGKINFIIGDSGCGKTTAAFALSNLLYKNEWEVKGPYNNISSGLKSEGNLANVFQEPKSFIDPSFSINYQLWESLYKIDKKRYQSVDSQDTREALNELLRIVRLSHLDLRCRVHEISGGESQRLMIAMALAGTLAQEKIKLIIADEPTSFLDFDNQESVISLFYSLLFEEKCVDSLLFITHDWLMISKYWKAWGTEACSCYDFSNEKPELLTYHSLCEKTKLNIGASGDYLLNKIGINGGDKAVLRVSDLNIGTKASVKRGIQLENISFEIREQEMLGIVGPSGCGKSTILNCILDILPEEIWTVSEDAVFKKGLSDSDIQAVFQDPEKSFNPNMTINELFFESFRLYKKGKEKFSDWFDYLVSKSVFNDYIDLKAKKHCYPQEFSGGQIQGLALLRALTSNPKLILADEPFSRLDLKKKFEIAETMKELQLRSGLSYLIATHDLQLAAYAFNRILILKKRNKKTVVSGVAVNKSSNGQVCWEYQGICDKYSDHIVSKLNESLNLHEILF